LSNGGHNQKEAMPSVSVINKSETEAKPGEKKRSKGNDGKLIVVRTRTGAI